MCVCVLRKRERELVREGFIMITPKRRRRNSMRGSGRRRRKVDDEETDFDRIAAVVA